jgi:signal transduction histidine kinase
MIPFMPIGEVPQAGAGLALAWWQHPLFIALTFLILGTVLGYLLRCRKTYGSVQGAKAVRNELERSREELSSLRGELEQTRKQLTYASAMASLGELTAGIAHEIRNPLNFINNFAAIVADLSSELKTNIMLRARTLSDEHRVEMDSLARDLSTTAEKIVEHGQRIDGIVRSMLLHAHGRPGEKEEMDVNAFVDQYVMLSWHGMRAQHQDFGVQLGKDYDETAGSMHVVPQDLARVLINLLNNAYHAVLKRQAQEKGSYVPKVFIRTGGDDRIIEITIGDNGGGVPTELEARIFDAFFTTKSSASGTGLGLSLSRDIITKEHGGELRLVNTPGEGAAFIIALPR